MDCRYCSKPCVKAGYQKNGKQKLYCKPCRKYQQQDYAYRAYSQSTNMNIQQLLTEGVSLRGIGRVLNISLGTVITRIKYIARSISKPLHFAANRVYEIDELWTFVKRKTNEVWVMYAFDRTTRSVIDLCVGARNKVNLKRLTDQVLSFEPKAVCTDGLAIYQSLVPKSIHKVGLPGTRHIERYNLNIRTHLKRLSRKTICFSKSLRMLEACLKIYFWSAKAPSGIRSSIFPDKNRSSLA